MPPSAIFVQSCGADDNYQKSYGPRNLRCQDSSQLLIRLDQQKVVGRLHFKPLPQTRPKGRQRHSQFLRRAEQPGNQLIQG
jgi:hypothetical protein